MSAPIILLHGVGLDYSIWDAVSGELATVSSEHPVRALDLPGHGGQAPLKHEVSLADLAADVLDRIDAVTTGSIHLVGFSLGALIAEYLAVHQPGRVLTLTCVASVCDRTPEESAAVLERLDRARRDFAGSAEGALQRWFPDDSGISGAAALKARTRRILLANNVDSYLHCYRVFATADAGLAPELHRITAPVLVVTGDDDPGSTPDMSHRLADRIADVRVHIIPGARHMLPDTHPELLSALIAEFITTAERS